MIHHNEQHNLQKSKDSRQNNCKAVSGEFFDFKFFVGRNVDVNIRFRSSPYPTLL